MKQNDLMCSPEIYARAIAIIKEFEGCKLEAYLDGGGVWTIGWGSTQGVYGGMRITREEAEKRLLNDFTWKAVAPVARHLKVELKANQLEALYSFVFNIGSGAWADSTLLKLINSGAASDVIAAEFEKWRFDNGVEVEGLLNRRIKEKELFLA